MSNMMVNSARGIVLLLVMYIASTVQGMNFVCQGGATFSRATNLCECDDKSLFYNAIDGQCQNICEYYGDSLCSSARNTVCSYDKRNATAFSCQCGNGFADNGDGLCTDIDECDAASDIETTCHLMNLKCVNTEGGYECACQKGNYMAQDKTCKELDVCNPPMGSPCDQICESFEGSEPECKCYEGFSFDPQEGKCVLKDEYETCKCDSSPDSAICYSDGQTKTCKPRPGFELAEGSQEEMQDIDECDGVHYCPSGSNCVNEVGYYYCQCITDFEWHESLGECLRMECPVGLVLYDHKCKDPCDIELCPKCPKDTNCLVDSNNIATCGCQIECQLDGRPTTSKFSIYQVSFYLQNINYPSLDNMQGSIVNDITKSFEIIFGLGNAELAYVTNQSTDAGLKVKVGVLEPVSDLENLLDIISGYCWSSEFVESEECILPGGLVINRNSLSLKFPEPCTSTPSPCQSNALCVKQGPNIMPGNYECQCFNGYKEVQNTTDFYCQDINECEQYNLCVTTNGEYCQNKLGSYFCSECCFGQVSELQKNLSELSAEVITLTTQRDAEQMELDDQNKTKNLIGGILGSMAMIAFVIFGINIGYILKLRN